MSGRSQFVRRLACATLTGVALAALSWHPALSARATESPETLPDHRLFGDWSTEGGSGVIAIGPCGTALCGRIVGIARAPGEPIPRDVNGESQCGLTIITNEKPNGDGAWIGQITDPRTGKTYGAKIWLGPDGNLRLRGFLGLPLFGQTQVWHPFNGRLGSDCAFS